MSGHAPRKAARANPHAPAPIRRVNPAGDSVGWEAQKENHSKLGDSFLTHVEANDSELSEKWGLVWDEVPEEYACDEDIHAVAAGYLADHHLQADGAGKGQLLHYNTAGAYWGGMVQTVHKRFSDSQRPQTQVRARVLPAPAVRRPARH